MTNFLCAATLLLAPVIEAHGDRTDWTKPPTPPDVTANPVVYSLDGKEYEGYVAYPTRHHTNPIPGVLIAHQWMGLGDMEKYRAEQMAAFGYKAFALDVYGKGIRPSNPKEAGGNSSALEADPAELHKRVNKGLSMLETEVNESVPVNKSALVANGYCFGGVMVLELARTGAPVVGVSSFHGELGNLTSQGNDQIKAAVQVHHADLDFQNASVLLAFENEMRNKKVATWATTKYGNCYHGWTDPTSSNYNAQAAIQSHASMRHFYAALLGLDYAC